jgi:hypothetical protein
MHIKFLPYGTGDPQDARAYLLALHDHNGRLRPEVRVLRGNPQLVADLAESLTFQHRYTSGVISWHVDDDPTAQEVQEALDDFERVAYAGLDPDQYSYAAISHGGHVHIFAARVELRSGHAHNMAPPGRQKAFDHLRDHWNFKEGWASPADPKRARQVQPGHFFKANLGAVRKVEANELLNAFHVEPDLQGREQRKAAIVDWIRGRVLAGAISTREDLIFSLGQMGELTRISKDFISILLPTDKKAIRLKGTLFDDRFDAESIRVAEMTPVNVVGNGRDAPNLNAAAQSKVALEEAIEGRRIYNQSRYKLPAPTPSSAQALLSPATALEEIAPPNREKIDDRIRNHLIEEALRAFQVSRNAIRQLAIACGVAVRQLAYLDRASESLERASRFFERFEPALKKHSDEVKRRLGGVK